MKNKEEQKQHLIDMMKSDEELGLYDESREIKFEDVFNDEKRERVKKFILEHKQIENDWDKIFDEYYKQPKTSFISLNKWLKENYEIPKKKNGKD
jgi:siroheme synthase (precorrin-2 oxidase/ferrochelatase)